jgi:hypothetical protein
LGVNERALSWYQVGFVPTKSTLRERPAPMNIPRLALRLREQMSAFLGNLSVPKTAWRFCLEGLYGIVTRQSLRLSEIGRSLK